MATLEKAIRIAARAHRGQKDKDGLPYILHPIRVMLKVDSEKEMKIAVLHDVVEKSKLTIDDLRKRGFSEDVVLAVDYLSKRTDEPYLNYIERAKKNELACRVKIADLEDKIELARQLKSLDQRELRLKRYREALQKLQKNR